MGDKRTDSPPDPAWVAEQVAKFSPDELRHAARVLTSLVADIPAASA
jgi:hypothetical protein